MKITRYIAIAAILVAILAAVAWVLRDNLIQRLSNPLLQDYGIAISDVSLDALATSDASISYLELTHQKGTSVIIEDLSLPLSTGKSGSKTYRARKVSIVTATRTEDEAFEMAKLIRQFITLPGKLADSVVIVDELSFAPYPAVSGIRWEIGETEQRLDGSVQSVGMSLRVARRNSGDHAVSFFLQNAQASIDGSMLAATLSDNTTGLKLTGSGAIHLPTWQSLARLTSIIPREMALASGIADLSFDIAIPNDPLQTPTLVAGLSPTTPVQLNYAANGAGAAEIFISSAGRTEITATFPELDWSLTLPEASFLLSYEGWAEIPFAISAVDCRAGTTCTLRSRVLISDAKLPVGRVGTAELSSAQAIHLRDTGIRVDVQSGALLSIDALANEQFAVDRVKARLASPASFEVVDADWRIRADSVDIEVDALAFGQDLSVSAPVFLENVDLATEGGRRVLEAGVYAPSVRATLSTQSIALPGLRGRLSLDDDDVAADLKTVGLGTDSEIRARHALSSGTGYVDIEKGAISFGSAKLSDRVSPWPHDGDIVAGTVSFEAAARWTRHESRYLMEATASVVATELAGYLGETAFSGVASQLEGTYRDGAGFKFEPSTATAGLVEVGIPLQSVEADYSLDLNARSIDVTRLSMSAPGGVISAEPFSFRTDSDVNTVTLTTDALDLGELLSLERFEALEITGSVAARLPVAMQGDFFTIADGVLTGNPPGGVIRYEPATRPGDEDTSGLGFAQRVLGNFEYETLASDVSMGPEGDLVLKLTLAGRNPDLDEQRPVVLNVVVENNIPQMLRSLRAARAVEDILEDQINR